MRVAKTDIIAGLPAELARSIVRKFRGREMIAEILSGSLESTGLSPETVLAGLETAGYMKKVRVDDDGDIWWDTTIQGNALAMASFGRPISRKTAHLLVSGLLERAKGYNADPDKPLFLNTLRVFGSYLNPEIDPLGDVDIELTYGRRITDQRALSEYARAEGRSFNTYMDELRWPQTELVQHLKKRSAFISITLEDITRITDRFETLYSIDADSEAVPPPADRSIVGR